MNASAASTWIPAWLQPAPDSIVVQMRRAGHRPWVVLFNLVWSGWVFASLAYAPVNVALLVSLVVSFPVFLGLFAVIHVRPTREAGLYLTVLTFLACVTMPWNTSAWAYSVFACAFLPWFYGQHLLGCGWRMALVLAAVVLQAWLLGWPWFAMMMMVGISLSVGLGSQIGQLNFRKNATERLSRDEVRRFAASAERERIGRDLHDLLGHTLSLITMKLELSRKLVDSDPERARRELSEAEDVARHSLAEVRSAVSGFRATGLSGELASAGVMLRASGVELTIGDMPALPDSVDNVLAMVVREAATNIHRHARATQAGIDVVLDNKQVCMRFHDDGRGGAREDGNGVNGMRERVESAGGMLQIRSQAGQGTELLVRMPLPTGTGAAVDGQAQIGVSGLMGEQA